MLHFPSNATPQTNRCQKTLSAGLALEKSMDPLLITPSDCMSSAHSTPLASLDCCTPLMDVRSVSTPMLDSCPLRRLSSSSSRYADSVLRPLHNFRTDDDSNISISKLSVCEEGIPPTQTTCSPNKENNPLNTPIDVFSLRQLPATLTKLGSPEFQKKLHFDPGDSETLNFDQVNMDIDDDTDELSIHKEEKNTQICEQRAPPKKTKQKAKNENEESAALEPSVVESKAISKKIKQKAKTDSEQSAAPEPSAVESKAATRKARQKAKTNIDNEQSAAPPEPSVLESKAGAKDVSPHQNDEGLTNEQLDRLIKAQEGLMPDSPRYWSKIAKLMGPEFTEIQCAKAWHQSVFCKKRESSKGGKAVNPKRKAPSGRDKKKEEKKEEKNENFEIPNKTKLKGVLERRRFLRQHLFKEDEHTDTPPKINNVDSWHTGLTPKTDDYIDDRKDIYIKQEKYILKKNNSDISSDESFDNVSDIEYNDILPRIEDRGVCKMINEYIKQKPSENNKKKIIIKKISKKCYKNNEIKNINEGKGKDWGLSASSNSESDDDQLW
eukprot:GHVL01003038.1.p1 GENE.GHVL01003038.1~~GHVL01003038.1.p1  ORF type:complete len:551 (+),score=164.53 GHVL01003038.1:177-1829(+)